ASYVNRAEYPSKHGGSREYTAQCLRRGRSAGGRILEKVGAGAGGLLGPHQRSDEEKRPDRAADVHVAQLGGLAHLLERGRDVALAEELRLLGRQGQILHDGGHVAGGAVLGIQTADFFVDARPGVDALDPGDDDGVARKIERDVLARRRLRVEGEASPGELERGVDNLAHLGPDILLDILLVHQLVADQHLAQAVLGGDHHLEGLHQVLQPDDAGGQQVLVQSVVALVGGGEQNQAVLELDRYPVVAVGHEQQAGGARREQLVEQVRDGGGADVSVARQPWSGSASRVRGRR